MKKATQLQYVKDKLREQGYITRNQCLKLYITRLASRIDDLKSEGWVLKGETLKTEFGSDYRYTLVREPEPTQLTI